MKVFLAVLVVVSSVAAQYGGHQGYGGPAGYGGHESYGHDEYAEPHYSFAYEVHDSHTGDIKSHKEERKGEHTQGVYYLVEPDGSKRTVEYIVEGKSGFNAKVLREGSKHPSGGYKSDGYSSGGYSSGGYSSGGYGGASSSSSFSTHGSLGGGYSKPSYQPSYEPAYKPSYSEPSYKPSYSEPSYKPSYSEPSYKPSYSEPSYKPSYGGQATSSISIATHGAKIATQTYHAAPSKHY